MPTTPNPHRRSETFGAMSRSEIEAFVSASELADKLAVLRRLDQSADALIEFERSAQILSASADDLALIESYRDLCNDRSGAQKSLCRSDSEVYWHRATGDQDFECVKSCQKTCSARGDAEYWEQVTIANNPDGFSVDQRKHMQIVPPPTSVPATSNSFWDNMLDNSSN